jgi:hypothetical protein
MKREERGRVGGKEVVCVFFVSLVLVGRKLSRRGDNMLELRRAKTL